MDDYRVKGLAKPDMTSVAFVAALRAGLSPVPDADAEAVYAYAVARKFSPAALLAWFEHESGMGRNGWAAVTKSWGNTRLPSFARPDIGAYNQDTRLFYEVGAKRPPGRYLSAYATWGDGGVSTVARFLDHPAYSGKDTVKSIVPVWAPASDGNSVATYIAAVLASIARYAAPPPPAPPGGTMAAVPKPLMLKRPSPNFGYDGADYLPQAVTWHISEGSETSAVGWLTNPASKASANYVIGRTGTLYELVNPEAGPNGAAWCNGDVQQPDRTNPLIAGWVDAGINPNRRTVSIECAGFTSRGKGGSLTAAQSDALIRLTAWICQRFGIAPDRTHILRHAQINDATRHDCPGFSIAEMDSWVASVAALAKPAPPPAPPAPPADPMLNPVVTERQVWGGQGKIIREIVIVRNTISGKYYEQTKEYTATGPVLSGYREV